MALPSRPLDYDSTDDFDETVINAIMDHFYDLVGYAVGSPYNAAGARGALDWESLSATANLRRSQTVDTAVVCGNTVETGAQTITRPTTVSGGEDFLQSARSGWGPDMSAGNVQDEAIVGAAQAIALDAGKGVYNIDAGAAASLSTITGGSDGEVVYLVTNNVNVTINHTATDTANTIWLRGLANLVGTVGGVIVKLRFLTPPGNVNGRWFEVS